MLVCIVGNIIFLNLVVKVFVDVYLVLGGSIKWEIYII